MTLSGGSGPVVRSDPDLGTVRRCRVCREWWPHDHEFYGPLCGGRLYASCRACRAELAQGITPPQRGLTDRHARTPEQIAKRRRQDAARYQRRRAANLEAERARQRDAQMRAYWRDPEAHRERERQRRAAAAAEAGRVIRLGFGRPRIAA